MSFKNWFSKSPKAEEVTEEAVEEVAEQTAEATEATEATEEAAEAAEVAEAAEATEAAEVVSETTVEEVAEESAEEQETEAETEAETESEAAEDETAEEHDEEESPETPKAEEPLDKPLTLPIAPLNSKTGAAVSSSKDAASTPRRSLVTVAPLPAIAPDAHKYSRGELNVFAGSKRFTGAAVLTACASERMGAGYTRVITAPEAVPIVRAASPSLVVEDLTSWEAPDSFLTTPSHPVACCVGSGFEGTTEERKLLKKILKRAECPVLVDGSALNFVAQPKFVALQKTRARQGFATVITPHSGEAARIAAQLNIPYDRTAEVAAALALATGTIVVLKGPNTFVSDGVRTRMMIEGTSALAKAGTGDVLSGMIGALLAQGMDPFEAAFAGVVIHARAGVAASMAYGERSVIAGDVIAFIPAVLRQG